MVPFDNTYARLPARLFANVAPTPVRAPRTIKVNEALAAELGIDPEDLTADVLAGNVVPPGATPIALAYAGHQFGNFVPQLGDGRAILLGEVVGRDGVRRDIQLKGSGRTPFSRGGDGRAALGPVLREYVVSEAMAALRVPTTRSLAAVATGEPVVRERLLPGAVLTRVAASHIRVGTFQYLAARRDTEALAALATYALARHYPDAVGSGNAARALLERVIDAQANLTARWLGVGFIHGVMNTDNTSISGETLDFGPCAFLDEVDPGKVFSSIDVRGRYAFANQPAIAHWNMVRLAEALLPLLANDTDSALAVAEERLDVFPKTFSAAAARVFRAKLGLVRDEPDDITLWDDLLERLAGSDYTIFFRQLCACAESTSADAVAAAMLKDPSAFNSWAVAWRHRIAREDVAPDARARAMRLVNPAFIPRNHRIEELIEAAIGGDFAPFETLTRVLEHPYDDQPEHAHLAEAPTLDQRVRQTFCGT